MEKVKIELLIILIVAIILTKGIEVTSKRMNFNYWDNSHKLGDSRTHAFIILFIAFLLNSIYFIVFRL